LIFGVLTAVKMTMLFFWVVTPCRLVGRNHCLEDTLKMETVCLSETLSTYETLRRHNPEQLRWYFPSSLSHFRIWGLLIAQDKMYLGLWWE
jgi:hypothetical protein